VGSYSDRSVGSLAVCIRRVLMYSVILPDLGNRDEVVIYCRVTWVDASVSTVPYVAENLE